MDYINRPGLVKGWTILREKFSRRTFTSARGNVFPSDEIHYRRPREGNKGDQSRKSEIGRQKGIQNGRLGHLNFAFFEFVSYFVLRISCFSSLGCFPADFPLGQPNSQDGLDPLVQVVQLLQQFVVPLV